MRKVIQFSIYKGESQFVAEGVNIPIVTQGKTLDELVNNLKEALELFLEGEDLSKYDIQTNPAIIANIELNNLLYA
ncbi:MAG: type II toxin-antitoxin system HicB family antitoxin [Ignavibacterium album]|jgi:predicted RNase H-like HicB family nuclease|uniref:type II toxin-antitoxin system HicB family antitoxin n=1 Tax=Ignavibacterium album TaxID=591197 RepID=UPI0026F15E8E|nr:type II toxin-antitoxin system HicB family antitoxin [Ignavibacterium album]MCX8104942.1 type II toxin-antitoxin system HicB family antitoxin [Ignavibacterium album]